MKFSRTIEKRFWAKVHKTPKCWVWNGASQRGGYGVISAGFWKGKIIAAHRLSWILKNGMISSTEIVCHKCDNPKCVRPSHLFIGTHADNVKDKIAKGRAYGGPFGNTWGRGKGILSIENAKSIKLQYKSGMKQRELAAIYKVSGSTISQIITGKLFHYLP